MSTDLEELEIRSILGIRRGWSSPGTDFAAPTPLPVRDVSGREREAGAKAVLFAGTAVSHLGSGRQDAALDGSQDGRRYGRALRAKQAPRL